MISPAWMARARRARAYPALPMCSERNASRARTYGIAFAAASIRRSASGTASCGGGTCSRQPVSAFDVTSMELIIMNDDLVSATSAAPRW